MASDLRKQFRLLRNQVDAGGMTGDLVGLLDEMASVDLDELLEEVNAPGKRSFLPH